MRTIAVFVENRPFFGALLVHIPLLHALRARHPGARIVLLAPFEQASLLVKLGCADEVVPYARGSFDVFRKVRHLAPDAIVQLRPASRGLDFAAGLQRAPERLGFDSFLGRRLYTRAVFHDTSIYRPRKYLTLLESREAALAAPLGDWFRAEIARTGAAAAGGRDTLAILPGGGAGDFKRWGLASFLALATRLAAREPALSFAWVLGPQETELAGAVRSSPLAPRSRYVVDRPVAELAALAFAARGAVGNDCGPGHVFQMCGCPFTSVLSDEDGKVADRLAEWIDGPNRARAVVSARGAAIASVPVERVEESVVTMLAENRSRS